MKILLIDIDSKIPNLALKKIEKYHKNKGDEIIWNYPLLLNEVDKIYVSSIFSWNIEKTKQYEYYTDLIGGSGYSITKKLPPKIDKVKPRINLGFTTRGCIRNCEFCIVPEKEGKIRIVADIYDIWDGKSKEIILLDNNILALPEHFKKICSQLRKEKIRVDFNQGLDCRLLTEEIAKELKSIRHQEYRFSFDSLKTEKQVLKTIELLKKYGIKKSIWFVLVGFDTTIKEDFHRLNLLKKMKQNAYVQRYVGKDKDIYNSKNKQYITMARWANQHHIFRGMTWEQFINHPANKNYKKYISNTNSDALF